MRRIGLAVALVVSMVLAPFVAEAQQAAKVSVMGTVLFLAGLALVLIVFFLRPRRGEEGWTVAIGALCHPRRVRLTFLVMVALFVGLFMALDRFSKFWYGR